MQSLVATDIAEGNDMFIRAHNFFVPLWPLPRDPIEHTRRLFTYKPLPCFLVVCHAYVQP